MSARSALAILACLFSLAASVEIGMAGQRCPPATLPFPEIADTIAQAINMHRSRASLAPVMRDACLDAIAQSHSVDMARSGEFGHSDLDARLDAARFPWRRHGENIAWDEGARDPAASVVRQWLESPSHRRTLEGDYRLTGIGVALGPKRRLYFTQVFVR